MDPKFIDAVQSKKLVRVRLALSNELMLDPRGVTFSEMLRYAESNLSSLYQDDDGKIYDNEKSKWSEDFLYDLKNGLDLNFSREKLALYEAVAKFVLREKAKQMEQDDIKEQTKSLSIQKNNYSEPTDSQINKKAIYTGVTIGGTAIAITGFCLQKIGLASLGLVGAIIGGVLLFNDSKK
jgi:hypothetical protein